jgi:3-deoxy-D-arabino-heptulosonate 7-phosphate (DAHP) synthase class II
MTGENAVKLAFLLQATDSMSDVLEKAAQNVSKSFSKIEQMAGKVGANAL